jgi:hypothetical protein
MGLDDLHLGPVLTRLIFTLNLIISIRDHIIGFSILTILSGLVQRESLISLHLNSRNFGIT